MQKSNVHLKPALSLISHITFVKEVEAGTPISYGGTFVAPEKMKIATIPVGYGDGYPRSLSNKGSVLIRGKRAKIVGRVCMDQFMVDVTDIPGAAFMDRVVLIGCIHQTITSSDQNHRLCKPSESVFRDNRQIHS